MVLCCFTPAVNAAETNNSKKKEHNCGTAPTTGNDKEQNQHHKRAAIANANEVSNVNIQKIDAYDVCCTPSPQMEDVADQSDNEDDVERNVSFETSVTEPTCSSPSREKEFTCSVASDVNHIANSMPKDRPYDEDCLVHINHRDKVQCEVAFNAAILQDLAQIDQEKSNSESENSHSSMHNDLVFDLM